MLCVTFADFLSSNYGFKKLIEFIQLFLLIILLGGLFCLSLGNLNTTNSATFKDYLTYKRFKEDSK